MIRLASWIAALGIAGTAYGLAVAIPAADHFQFAIVGDRTGEAQPGVYEAVWGAVKKAAPQFAINVGDTIQGGNDKTAVQEWREAETIRQRADRRTRFYLIPGNHDIWSPKSEQIYKTVTHRPVHYSFDCRQAHFTVLDNSRNEDLSADEMTYLRQDLAAHRAAPVKFILFHRPYWIVQILLRNPEFALQKIAKEFGVQYVICGHLHEMLHLELDGVQYVSMVSSGGHLRSSKAYEAGWFFGYGLVDVDGTKIHLTIHELTAPFGKGRVTDLSNWSATGIALH